MRRVTAVPGVTIQGPPVPRHAEILTNEALAFVAELHRGFETRRRELLSGAGDDAPSGAAPSDFIDRQTGTTEPAPPVDFQTAKPPSWRDLVAGQLQLKEEGGTLCPRGWKLSEEHLTVDGQPVCAALFDVGLYAFHGAQTTLARGASPHVVLPEHETQREAALWHELLQFAEATLGFDAGAIKTTSVPHL
jgi:malate synthase